MVRPIPGQDAVGPSDLAEIDNCRLHQRTPYLLQGVSRTQLSVVRYYGCCTYNGEKYTYLPETDELIRDDVLAWLRERKRRSPGQ